LNLKQTTNFEQTKLLLIADHQRHSLLTAFPTSDSPTRRPLRRRSAFNCQELPGDVRFSHFPR
jgi:hypothetical protein